MRISLRNENSKCGPLILAAMKGYLTMMHIYCMLDNLKSDTHLSGKLWLTSSRCKRIKNMCLQILGYTYSRISDFNATETGIIHDNRFNSYSNAIIFFSILQRI